MDHSGSTRSGTTARASSSRSWRSSATCDKIRQHRANWRRLENDRSSIRRCILSFLFSRVEAFWVLSPQRLSSLARPADARFFRVRVSRWLDEYELPSTSVSWEPGRARSGASVLTPYVSFARAECSAKYNRGVQEIFEEASPTVHLLCPACWATKLTRRGLDHVNCVVSCRLRGSRSLRRGAVRLAGAVERRTATRTSATVCSCEQGFLRRVLLQRVGCR